MRFPSVPATRFREDFHLQVIAHAGPTTIEERTAALATLHARVFAENGKKTNPRIESEPILHLDDASLIERARNAKNGTRFAALWSGDTEGYDSSSEADLALCSLLASWTRGDPARIDRLFRQSGLVREKWEREDYRDRTIQKAMESWDPRPIIQIRQELNPVADEGIQALAARPDLGLFVRGLMLVTVGRDGSSRGTRLERPPGSPVIVVVEQARMLALLDAAAGWRKWNVKKGELVPARPPEWVAAQLLARLAWPLPYLQAVIETPTLRPDGSILDTPGWDPSSGLLFEPMPGIEWPHIPDRPTRAQVNEALGMLLDPVSDFPFVATSDRSAYLAAVFSLLVRHMIDGPVPMFVHRAPTPGSGKGLLANVTGLVGTGRELPAMTMSHEDEELRRRITSLAVSGTAAVHLDNLSGSDSEQFMVPLAPDAPAIQETTEPRSEKPPLLMVAKASEQDRLPHAVKLYSFEEIPQAELSHAQRVQTAEMAVMARSRGGRVPVFALPTPLA